METPMTRIYDRPANVTLEQLSALCAQLAQDAHTSGQKCKERHLRRALRHMQSAQDVPPPIDIRQQFFAAMLEHAPA